MSLDPSFQPVRELLVTSIDPATGIAEPNAEWIRELGPADDCFRALNRHDREECWRLIGVASGGSMTVDQFLTVAAGDEVRGILMNFLPVHLPGRTRDLPVIVTGEFLEQPVSLTTSQTEGQRMETLGRMTMGMAHDFNNLLSGIIGHAELMRNALRDDVDLEVLEEHVRTIERAALDGGALIKKIQRYIRKEQKAAHIPLDLPTLIQDCVVLTRPYWYNEPRRQGIAISVEQNLEEVPSIMGSASELRDVLVNLILNAVQAMPQGGLLTFRSWTENSAVKVSIGDTGVGMSEAVRARIFDPQFTTKGEKGSGMGLAVAHGVVRDHNGNIRVETRLGAGTSFILEFPPGSDTVPDEDAEDSAGEESGLRGLRILVVDDEPMVRSVLRKLLGLRGHEVVEADSGSQGLNRLGESHFDVIITDQGMPEMSGRQFARQAHAMAPTVPIMLLTGDTHAGSSDESIAVVLAKPFKIAEIESTLASLVGHGS